MNITLEPVLDSVVNRARVQAILEAAPTFTLVTEGRLPAPDAAQGVFESVPPNGTRDRKRVYLIRADAQDVGVIDLYLGWNTVEKVCIGLFMLIETQHRRGIGAKAYALLHEEIRSWRKFTTLRIGVVQTNLNAFPFWRAMGFLENGEIKHGEASVAPIVILERPI